MKFYLNELKLDISHSRYARVNINTALSSALNDKEIKKHKHVVKRLKELKKKLENYPWSYVKYYDIDLKKQEELMEIKKEAYELVRYI